MKLNQRVEAAAELGRQALAQQRVPKGGKFLGRGLFAFVFEAYGLAVKVSRKRGGYAWSTRSNAYEVAGAIQDGELRSKHFPKIYDVYRDPGSDGFVIVMEKLSRGGRKAVGLNRAWDASSSRWGGNPLAVRYVSSAVKTQWKTLCAALNQLEEYGFSVTDIHGGNVLQRKNGTLVLTDVVL